MFVVSTIKNQKIEKEDINKKSNNLISSPYKSKQKQSPSKYCFTLQTNNSSFSGIGGSINDFQEQIIFENNQEKNNRNELLGKKTKFKVNYININKEKNSKENKDAIKEKKEKKKNSSKLLENKTLNGGRWNDDEHLKFIEAIYYYTNDWKEVQKYVRTRTPNQVRSHAQKFILKLRTFKDSSLGIDFTENNFKNLKEIIKKIKEIEQNTNKNNILLLLNQKLSENNLKNSHINTNNKNEKIVDENIKTNIEEKNIDKENLNNNENNYEKEKFKIEKSYENIEEKTKNESNNKEILEQKKDYYFDYEFKNNLRSNYEIINDIIYETNNSNFIPYNNNYNSKEQNTISMINKGYFS